MGTLTFDVLLFIAPISEKFMSQNGSFYTTLNLKMYGDNIRGLNPVKTYTCGIIAETYIPMNIFKRLDNEQKVSCRVKINETENGFKMKILSEN